MIWLFSASPRQDSRDKCPDSTPSPPPPCYRRVLDEPSSSSSQVCKCKRYKPTVPCLYPESIIPRRVHGRFVFRLVISRSEGKKNGNLKK